MVERYAEVEYDALPAECDAVVYGLTTSRPTVLADPSQPPRRLRFSLAHELGHVLVPGHIGIEACHTASSFYYSTSDKEREAHVFASEILVPRRWLDAVVADCESVGDVLIEVDVADVSAAAACLATIRALPSGSVVALMQGSVVDMALASPGTVVNRPEDGQPLDARQLDKFSETRGSVSISGRNVRWWSFGREVALQLGEEEGTASDALREIVSAVYAGRTAEADAAFKSISAITGHAKGAYRFETPEELHANLRSRLASRPALGDVIAHPNFDRYLVLRALELARPR